jgi:hypothetical protein
LIACFLSEATSRQGIAKLLRMAVTEGFLRTPHSPLQLKLSLRKPETLLKYLFGSVPSDNLKAAVMVIQTNATTPDLEMRTLFHTALIRRVFRNGTADARRHSRIGPCRHRARRTVRCRASHADWLFGLCVMMEDGEPIPGQAGTSGSPTIRGFALPAHEWLIEDTWYVAGLKGTGSNHIALADKLVPAANFFDLDGPSCAPGSLYRGLLPSLPLLHGAFAVGMAQGSLDELLAMANTGRQQLRAATPMRDSETFQFELGRVTADVRAVRAVHHAQVAGHWQHALAGTMKDEARYVAMWRARRRVSGWPIPLSVSPMRASHSAAAVRCMRRRHCSDGCATCTPLHSTRRCRNVTTLARAKCCSLSRLRRDSRY